MKQVTKRTGTIEGFDQKKLFNSIINAGGNENLARQVTEIVAESIRADQTNTDRIFSITRRYLMEADPGIAALYALDRGLSLLGPAGFIFEQYVAALFREMNYDVDTNLYAKGEAVEHEVDVVARKGNMTFIVEAKYRNDFHIKTHIDQVMYADARLEDVRRRALADGDTREYYMWVITNTRFTDHSESYVTKRDLQLMGWDYPRFINLKKIAHEKKLYPVTVLPSVTKSFLKQCAQKQMILAKDIYPMNVEEIQKEFDISAQTAKKIEQEVLQLMF